MSMTLIVRGAIVYLFQEDIMPEKMKKNRGGSRKNHPAGSRQELLRVADEYRKRFGNGSLSQLDTPSFIRVVFGSLAR